MLKFSELKLPEIIIFLCGSGYSNQISTCRCEMHKHKSDFIQNAFAKSLCWSHINCNFASKIQAQSALANWILLFHWTAHIHHLRYVPQTQSRYEIAAKRIRYVYFVFKIEKNEENSWKKAQIYCVWKLNNKSGRNEWECGHFYLYRSFCVVRLTTKFFCSSFLSYEN